MSGFLTWTADACTIELGDMKAISIVVGSLASAMAGRMLKYLVHRGVRTDELKSVVSLTRLDDWRDGPDSNRQDPASPQG